MTIRGDIVTLIHKHDLNAIKLLHINKDEALLKVHAVFGGGTWMHQAAAYGTPDILQWLQSIGFDPDARATYEGDRPLSSAAHENNIANAKWLLKQSVTLDTGASVRNPLFAAVVGKSPEIVKLLLDAGIEADVRYTSPTMKKMDAMAFALFRSMSVDSVEAQIATQIARRLSNGDSNKMEALLRDAEKRARMNGAPKTIRLVPTIEELESMRWDDAGDLIVD